MSDIKYVFLTHAHDDHAGFLNELLEKCPHIKVIASGKAIPTLLRGQNSFVGGCSGIGAFISCKFMGLLGEGRHLFPPVDRRHLDRFIEVSPQAQKDAETLLEGKILFTPDHNMDRGQNAVSAFVGYPDRGTRKINLSRPRKPF